MSSSAMTEYVKSNDHQRFGAELQKHMKSGKDEKSIIHELDQYFIRKNGFRHLPNPGQFRSYVSLLIAHKRFRPEILQWFAEKAASTPQVLDTVGPTFDAAANEDRESLRAENARLRAEVERQRTALAVKESEVQDLRSSLENVEGTTQLAESRATAVKQHRMISERDAKIVEAVTRNQELEMQMLRECRARKLAEDKLKDIEARSSTPPPAPTPIAVTNGHAEPDTEFAGMMRKLVEAAAVDLMKKSLGVK